MLQNTIFPLSIAKRLALYFAWLPGAGLSYWSRRVLIYNVFCTPEIRNLSQVATVSGLVFPGSKKGVVATNPAERMLQHHLAGLRPRPLNSRGDFPLDLKQRILNNIAKAANGCWEWQRRKSWNGYGMIKVNQKPRKAHRVAWEVFNGAIPEKLFVLHKCDNRVCVNPDHLYVGVHLDNMRDMKMRGRAKGGNGPGGTKLTAEERELITRLNMPRKEIAEYFGVCADYISTIKSRLKSNGA